MTDPDEYDQLLAREYKPYSKEHMALYETIASLLQDKPADILEVGVGIGYGISHLKAKNCIKTYTGVEPSKKCYEYLQYYVDDKINIINEKILDVGFEKKTFDFVIFIETLEHLPKEEVYLVIRKLSKLTRIAMFMSTPKKETNDHGLLTGDELHLVLTNNGWNYTEIEWQKPHTLYICNPYEN